MDKFKKIVKEKVQFDPVHTTRDQDIWGKLDAQIAAYEAAKHPYKKYYVYAAAASVVLCLGIVFMFLKQPAPQLTADKTKMSPKTESPVEVRKGDLTVLDCTGTKLETKEVQPQYVPSDDEVPSFNLQADASTWAPHKAPEYFELADGTVIALDKKAALQANPSFVNNRAVQLQGRGYFEVAHDATRPFKVYFGGTHLVVLGTKFYVESLHGDHSQKVTVVEGRVKVYNPHHKNYTVVTKGQELVIINNKELSLNTSIEPHVGQWKKGSLAFSDTKLDKVFFTLAKEKGQQIQHAPQVSNCLFSGDLSGMDLKEALNFIKITSNLVIEEKVDHIYISGKSCD